MVAVEADAVAWQLPCAKTNLSCRLKRVNPGFTLNPNLYSWGSGLTYTVNRRTGFPGEESLRVQGVTVCG